MLKKVIALLLVCTFLVPVSLATGENIQTEEPMSISVAAEAEEIPIYLVDDGTYTFKERAADLVSRLTLAEKGTQMGNSPAAIPRLGIPAFVTWNEALHGLRNLVSVSYPISGSMGNTWNPDLIKEMSDEIAVEARAHMNNFLERRSGEVNPGGAINTAEGGRPNQTTTGPGNNWGGRGLTFWSPVIEPQREPRWGRNSEAYSEDTFLTAQLGKGFIDGLHGDDEVYDKAFGTGKHFIANNVENVRMYGSSMLTEQDLYEYYIRPYRSLLLQSQMDSIMSAYNRVNDVPMTASVTLLDTLARKTWGLKGYITTDCQAGRNIHEKMTYVGDRFADEPSSHAVAAALALIAGIDTDCTPANISSHGGNGGAYWQAVELGYIAEHELDEAIAKMYETRLRLGMLYYDQYSPWRKNNPVTPTADWTPDTGSAWTLSEDAVPGPEYIDPAGNIEQDRQIEIATRMAEEAIVLLENHNNFLPLNKAAYANKKIALVGPYENRVDLGGYSGNPSQYNRYSPRRAMLDYFAPDYEYAKHQALPTAAGSVVGDNNTTIAWTSGGATDAQPLDKMNFQGIQVNYRDGTSIFRHWNSVIQEESFGYREYNDWSGRWIRLTEDVAKLVIGDVPNAQNIESIQFRSLTNGAYNVQMSGIQWTVTAETGGGLSPAFNITGNSNGVNYPVDLQAQSSDGTLVLNFTYSPPPFDPSALADVADADLFLVFVGADTSVAAEEKDRPHLRITGSQHDMIMYMAENYENVVVIMETMGMIEVEEYKDNVDALLYYQYNGQTQGLAIRNALFNINGSAPGGRLPMTWYQGLENIPEMEDYAIRDGESEDTNDNSTGRTYMYYDGPISYPFGYGLTYTSFTYSNATIDKTSFTPNDGVTLSVDVTNNGTLRGSEVVQIYVTEPFAEDRGRPDKRLVGFEKVWIDPGMTERVSIPVAASELWYYDDPTGDSLNKTVTPLDVKNTSSDHVIDGKIAYYPGVYTFEVAKAASNMTNTGDAANSFKLNATMGGSLDLKLQAVTIESGTIDSGKPRVIARKGTLQTAVEVALNNDTFLDNADVTYTSNRPEVATVDDNGRVTARSNGAFTITATVAYNGGTMSDEVALKVVEPSEVFAQLYDLVAEMENLDADDYIGDRWAEFDSMLTSATDVLGNIYASDSEIYTALNNLQLAAGNLSDKSTLKGVIDYAEEQMALATYKKVIASVRTNFEASLAKAVAVNNEIYATVAEVYEAWTDLLQWIHALDMVEGDKSLLLETITAANSIDLTDYVARGQARFIRAREYAIEVYDNPPVSQLEIDEATSELISSMLALRLKADTSILEQLLASAKAMTLSRWYTANSVLAFTNAIEAAEMTIAQGLSESDQQVVDNAAAKLQSAMDGLTYIRVFSDVEPEDWYYDYVMAANEDRLMIGIGNGIFAPEEELNRAMVVQVLYNMEDRPSVKGEALTFTDVAGTHWSSQAIMWATKTGIIKGYGNGKFGPDDNIKRQDIAAILYRYAEYKGNDTTVPSDFNLAKYTDVSEISDYAVKNMRWAVYTELINGRTDTTLVPLGTTKRAECATLLTRFTENIVP